MIANLKKPKINWDLNKKIFVKHNAIDKSICRELVAFGDRRVKKNINKYPEVFNANFNSCLLPLNFSIHSQLQETWNECINFFNFDINFVEPYELKKYDANDLFEQHVDNYYSLSVNIDRKITMSVQLSDINEYEGGEFSVLKLKHKLPIGSIIAFPSFIPHSVEKIISGTRWSLIGWAWGPYWR